MNEQRVKVWETFVPTATVSTSSSSLAAVREALATLTHQLAPTGGIEIDRGAVAWANDGELVRVTVWRDAPGDA